MMNPSPYLAAEEFDQNYLFIFRYTLLPHTLLHRNGDMTLLRVEAVVNPSNETLTDKNPISLRLFEAAGPELREECKTQIISKLRGMTN